MALISTVPKKPAAANQLSNQTPPVQKQLTASALQQIHSKVFSDQKPQAFQPRSSLGARL
jgi:hypothetical protein